MQKKIHIMLIEDDIYFIHAPQHPTSSTTSTDWHMCTGLMDIQASISAIPRTANCQKLHRIIPVVSKTGAVKQCRGGVSTGAILEHFKEFISHFLSQRTWPHYPHSTKMSDAKKSCENLRYKGKR